MFVSTTPRSMGTPKIKNNLHTIKTPERNSKTMDLIQSMSPHAITLLSCILKKIHVYRSLSFSPVSVSIRSLYTSYFLPRDTHLRLHAHDVQNVVHMLCKKGYYVYLHHHISVRRAPDHRKPFCTITWRPGNTQAPGKHQETDPSESSYFPATAPLEPLCKVNIPYTEI